MLRRPTYRPNGVRMWGKARELAGAFGAFTERSPWALKTSVLTEGSLNAARPHRPTTDAQSVGEAREVVSVRVPGEPEEERIAVPCFVIFAPGTPVPRAARSVSNEGGLIRFGLDSRDDRDPTVK